MIDALSSCIAMANIEMPEELENKQEEKDDPLGILIDDEIVEDSMDLQPY